MTACLFQHGIEASPTQNRLTVLGGIGFGYSETQIASYAGSPVLGVAASVLSDSGGQTNNLLLTDATVRREDFDALSTARNDELLFGALVIDEASVDGGLENATATAYAQIFTTLDRLGYPVLQRLWNFLPAINTHSHGLERYRQFNAGRQQAFKAATRPISGNVPPASAVGTATGSFAVAFVAAKQPFLPIESPRQVSAYCYPPQYGASSPVFSRAGLAKLCNQEALLISGTAAITGHQSLHPGDVVAQTRETLTNLRAIVATANTQVQSERYSLQTLDYVVYVRHPEQADRVMQLLREAAGEQVRALCVQADICRAELLVEIEAIGVNRTCA